MTSLPTPNAVVEVTAEDGAVLCLRRHGNPGAPTRLFVSHGNGFATDGYGAFWSRFLRDFDLVVFDMRNHGQNPPADPAHHNYAHMVRDIDAIGRAARAEWGHKPAAGLFHSMSAQSALLQAMAGGAHFEALVLFDPPNVPPPGDPARQPMLAYLDMLVAWAARRRNHFDDPEQLAAAYGITRSGRQWQEGTRLAMAGAVLRRGEDGGWALACPGALEASMYRQGATLDLWPRQRDIPVPVTLIGADPDRANAATGRSNRALAEHGGFAYRNIPGTSHLLQLEAPADCADLARDILATRGLR